MSTVVDKLKAFAGKHGLILEEKGEVGFGRPCVGLLDKRGNYVDHNPHDSVNYDPIFEDDERLYAPDGVNSYHKHDCMAVLVDDEDYESGLEQLYLWVSHLENQGKVKIVSFETGATGMQAIFSGTTGYAITLEDK